MKILSWIPLLDWFGRPCSVAGVVARRSRRSGGRCSACETAPDSAAGRPPSAFAAWFDPTHPQRSESDCDSCRRASSPGSPANRRSSGPQLPPSRIRQRTIGDPVAPATVETDGGTAVPASPRWKGKTNARRSLAAVCLVVALVFSVGCVSSRAGASGLASPPSAVSACCVDGCQPPPACGCPDDYRAKCEPYDPCFVEGCRPDAYCAKPLPCDPCPAPCGRCDDYVPKCDALAPWRPAPGYICVHADPCPATCSATCSAAR